MLDPNRARRRTHALFPFVTTRSDERGRSPIVTIGDAARIVLLDARYEDRRLLYREDLEESDIDPVEAYLDARWRLARAVRARLVGVAKFRGPWDVPCLAFEHPFLAASCLVLPDLYERAHARLHTESMCIFAPRRDVLVVAPDLGRPFRLALRDLLGSRSVAGERDAIYVLEPSGPAAMRALPPGAPSSTSLACAPAAPV